MVPDDLEMDEPDEYTGYSDWALSLASLAQQSHP